MGTSGAVGTIKLRRVTVDISVGLGVVGGPGFVGIGGTTAAVTVNAEALPVACVKT
jgi:hypothetical protein